MSFFDYSAPAELFLAKPAKGFLVEIGNPRHRFIPMVARRSTTAWEILWSRPTEVLDGHCVLFARPKYRRQPLGPPNGRFWHNAEVAVRPAYVGNSPHNGH